MNDTIKANKPNAKLLFKHVESNPAMTEYAMVGWLCQNRDMGRFESTELVRAMISDGAFHPKA